jgi:hypothetical protein
MPNPYAAMNPDQLLEQAKQCIELMGSDCDFHTRYRDFCDLFIAMAVTTSTLIQIARKNFNDGNWQPPPPELTLVEKKD